MFKCYSYITCAYVNLLVFRVNYERPMVIDSLNLKLRQIARFSLNMILDEMLNVICFWEFFLIVQHGERSFYHIHIVTSCSDVVSASLTVR